MRRWRRRQCNSHKAAPRQAHCAGWVDAERTCKGLPLACRTKDWLLRHLHHGTPSAIQHRCTVPFCSHRDELKSLFCATSMSCLCRYSLRGSMQPCDVSKQMCNRFTVHAPAMAPRCRPAAAHMYGCGDGRCNSALACAIFSGYSSYTDVGNCSTSLGDTRRSACDFCFGQQCNGEAHMLNNRPTATLRVSHTAHGSGGYTLDVLVQSALGRLERRRGPLRPPAGRGTQTLLAVGGRYVLLHMQAGWLAGRPQQQPQVPASLCRPYATRTPPPTQANMQHPPSISKANAQHPPALQLSIVHIQYVHGALGGINANRVAVLRQERRRRVCVQGEKAQVADLL
jgi:hypothetical protein